MHVRRCPGSIQGCLLLAVSFVFEAALASAQVAPEILPTGMSITPMAPRGVEFQTLNPGLPSLPDFKAGMAVTLALSPDGRTLLVLTSGFNQNLDASGNVDPATSNEYVFAYDVSGRDPAQAQVLPIQANAFDGLAWRPDGKEFYVSGGHDDLVHVFTEGSGGWIETSSIPLNHNGVGLGLYGILPVVAGLAVTADGRHLLAANYENDSVSVVDLGTHSVGSELDLRPGMIDPSENGKAGGTYPYWIVVKGNDRAYVSSQRDREVDVLDLSPLPALTLIDRIKLPGQPNKMILDRGGSRLFVAQDNTDTIAVVDTTSDKIVEEIDTIAPPGVFANAANLKGAGPNGLALSTDETRLYVTNGGTNSVSVIRLGYPGDMEQGSTARTIGLIPTAWYPNAVAANRDGSMLYVVNGKSMPGPNPKACIDAAAVTSDYGNYSCAATNQYIYQIMHAGLASFPTPTASELEALTKQVAENDGFSRPGDEQKDGPVSGSFPRANTRRDRRMMEFLHQRIHHVLFIVKENKTYDQVLGDLEAGNGDPDLVALPEVLTPNHHALARKFVTLDNT